MLCFNVYHGVSLERVVAEFRQQSVTLIWNIISSTDSVCFIKYPLAPFPAGAPPKPYLAVQFTLEVT